MTIHSPLRDTHLTEKKDTILVASWDPVLAGIRKDILEKEGFAVLQTEKRRVWVEARKVCKAPGCFAVERPN